MKDAEYYIEQLLERLKKHNPYLILLFGSYAYGSPHEYSDIDILFVTNDNFIPENYDQLLFYRLNISKDVRDIARKFPLDLLIFPKPLFEDFKKNSPLAREILSKGKILYEINDKSMVGVRS